MQTRDLHDPPRIMAGNVAPRSSILILLLAVAITASPLRGFVHSSALDEGSGHAHQHSHFGEQHDHHHHHDGDDQDDSSPGSEHHSALDHTSGGSMIAWMAPARRLKVVPLPFAPGAGVLTAPVCGDCQPIRRAKPPPWLLPARSSQVAQLRTVILLV